METGRSLYLVGGAWRGLCHLDMHLTASALPGVHGYTLAPARLGPLREAIEALGPRGLKEVPGVSAARIPMLDDAAALLAAVAAHLAIETLIVSGFGLREGLLFEALDAGERGEDPLLAATADYAARQGSARWDGDAVDEWIGGLFDDDLFCRRIRCAACRLAGVDLHPLRETRARHGFELAWLGAWIGIDAEERALLAATLWTAWGGRGPCEPVAAFLPPEGQRQAAAWGQAIRLAERLSGGESAVLRHARLTRHGEAMTLAPAPGYADLASGVAAKQLGLLAQQLGLIAAVAP